MRKFFFPALIALMLCLPLSMQAKVGHLLPGEGTAGLKKRKTPEAASLLVAVAAHEATCVVARVSVRFSVRFGGITSVIFSAVRYKISTLCRVLIIFAFSRSLAVYSLPHALYTSLDAGGAELFLAECFFRICFKIIASLFLNLLFGLSVGLLGIFALSILANRPLFAAP